MRTEGTPFSRIPSWRVWAVSAVFTALRLADPAAPDARAGMVLQEETILSGVTPPAGAQTPGQNKRLSVVYLEGKHARTETEKQVVILDFSTGKVFHLNTEAKTYSELTLEQIREAQKQAAQWMAHLKEQMKKDIEKAPPEKRAEMEKKMAALPPELAQPDKPVKISVRETGRKEQINGFPCQEVEILEDGQKAASYWLTKAVPGKEFETYQTEMAKWMEGVPAMGGERMREWPYVRDKGFPIRIERTKPVLGKILFTWEVKQVREESLSESLFRPPEDYTRTEAPPLPGQPRLPQQGTGPARPPTAPAQNEPGRPASGASPP